MSGEELYALWSAANDAHDVGVDEWEQLSDGDRDVWQTMADSLP